MCVFSRMTRYLDYVERKMTQSVLNIGCAQVNCTNKDIWATLDMFDTVVIGLD